MSKVMQALAQSEKGYQASNHHFATVGQNTSRRGSSSGSMLVNVGYLLLPTVLVLSWQGYQSYEKQVDTRLQSAAPQEIVVIETGSSKLDYPTFTLIGPTPLREVWETDESSVSVKKNPTKQSTTVNQQVMPVKEDGKEDTLDQLDLSELSPELALKVESALASVQAEEKISSQAISLVSNAYDYYGKLPPLNFQTHVYSSEPNKRWVKVNGEEYKEGDWIQGQVKVIAIEPQRTLVDFEQEIIAIPALYEWQG